MATTLTEMLELPNFGLMTTFTILIESNDEIFFVTSWTEMKMSFTLF